MLQCRIYGGSQGFFKLRENVRGFAAFGVFRHGLHRFLDISGRTRSVTSFSRSNCKSLHVEDAMFSSGPRLVRDIRKMWRERQAARSGVNGNHTPEDSSKHHGGTGGGGPSGIGKEIEDPASVVVGAPGRIAVELRATDPDEYGRASGEDYV